MPDSERPAVNILESTRRWLEEHSGYPLEMRIAAALTASGFGVVQGDYFEDEDKGHPVYRELDVTGYVTSTTSNGQLSAALLIECKSGVEKPWILFTAEHGYSDTLAVVRRSSTIGTSSQLLNTLQFDPKIQQSHIFKLPSRCGYSLVVGMRKASDNDLAYQALTGVCTATRAHGKRLSDRNVATFGFPILVIKAPLLECYLDKDGAVQLAEIDKGTLIWRNPVINAHTIVDIYTDKRFVADAGSLRAALQEFADLAGPHLDLLTDSRAR